VSQLNDALNHTTVEKQAILDHERNSSLTDAAHDLEVDLEEAEASRSTDLNEA
jgi:hypothetical protein